MRLRRHSILSLLADLLAAMGAIGCGGDAEEGAAGANKLKDGSSAVMRDVNPSGGAGDRGDTSSGSSSNEAGSRPIGKAKFLEGAEAICRRTIKRITTKAYPLLEREQKKSDYDQVSAEAKLTETIMLPELRSEIKQIRALGIPRGDERQVEAILAATQEVIDKGERDAAALVEDTSAFEESAALAERYGLEECPFG